MRTRDVQYYFRRLDKSLADMRKAGKEIGETLIEAEAMLGDEYGQVVKYLNDRGFLLSDIKTARAIASGELNEMFWFAGVKNSKVLGLASRPEVQRKIVQGAKFKVLNKEGKLVDKTFWEMLPSERNLVLGPKGGMPKGPEHMGEERTYKPITAKSASFNGQTLLLQAESRQTVISLENLAKTLVQAGQADSFRVAFAKAIRPRACNPRAVGVLA